MSSAFDAVCHHTLIDRLQSDFGVADTSLQWILPIWTFVFSMRQLCNIWVYCDLLWRSTRSVLGPVLFTAYVDDVNVYTSLSSTAADLTQLTLCTNSLQHWLWHNWLLNPDKSVAALFGPLQRLAWPGWPTHVAVAGSDIKCLTLWRFLFWCHTWLVDDARHSSDSDSPGL